MDLTKEALNYLTELGIEPASRVVIVRDSNGMDRTFIVDSNGKAAEVSPENYSRAKQRLQVHTLNGLCSYIESQIERQDTPLFIQVEDEQTVSLLGKLDVEGKREELLVATAIVPDFNYEYFMETEQLIISLQSKFVPSEDRDLLLKVIGNVKEENVRTTGDDGVSQAIKVKQGLTTVADVKVPNPVSLAPYRTFLEVEQPTSDFIFRMKDGPRGAIFESDGGAWRNEAIKNIANYLYNRLIIEPTNRGEEPYNVTIIA